MENTVVAIPEGWMPWLSAAAVFVIVGISLWAWWRYRKASIPWVPLESHGYYPGSNFFGPADVSPKHVVECLQHAESALIKHTKWTAANLAVVGPLVHVWAVPAESWTDLWGRKVAGLQIGYMLQVGKSLSALCHEMAHLCEMVLDKEIDDTHSTWKDDGILKAIDEYGAWLKAQPTTATLLAMGVQPLASTACRYGKQG